MKLTGIRQHLSIEPFGEIEVPDFTLIIGLNGAGKSHFLQAIEQGAVQTDVAGPKTHPADQGGVRLLRNDDPIPDGLAVGIKTEPNSLFQPGSVIDAHSQREGPTVLETMRQQLLFPMRERIQDALGGDLVEIADPPELALRLPFVALVKEAEGMGFRVDVEALKAIYAGVELDANAVPTHYAWSERLKSAGRVAEKVGLPPLGLSDEDVDMVGSWGGYPIFDTHFVQVFAAYRDKKLLNAFRRVTHHSAADVLTEEEFESRWGGPPWERVSEALALFGLPYRVQEPSTDPHAHVYFVLERQDGIAVSFGNLSSGEKVLIRFALSAFQVDEARVNVIVPKLLLLDEVDAALHPQNVHRLLEAIKTGFVDGMKVPVIMTTHSPTTVALAPEATIFEMTEENRVPRPITKQQALNRLTVGLPTLSVDYSGRRQVFTESSVDASQYDRISNLLKSQLDLPRTLTFISAGGSEGGDSRGGCTIVTRIVKALAENGVKSVYGLVDWDGVNEPNGQIKVLAYNTHYTKENVLLDPLLVAILLMLDKPSGLTFAVPLAQVSNAKAAELQALANIVLDRLTLDGELSRNRYLGSFEIILPKEYQVMKGHELEAKLVDAFPSLNRYSGSGKWLADPIIDRVLSEFPQLCPKPVSELLVELATELPS